MHDMTNEEIIRAYDWREITVSALKQELAELKSLEKHIAVLKRGIRAAESVSYIHEGVPMSETGGPRHIHIHPVSSGMIRWANIYRNATNGKRWGLTLRHYNGDSGGECMGATKKACVEAAKEWIATGKKPEEDWC